MDFWDPSLSSPKEAIDDAILAVDIQAPQFFEDWTDQAFAYEELSRSDSLCLKESLPKDRPYVFALPKPGSIGYLKILATLAAALDRRSDEIAFIEKLNTLTDRLTGSGRGAGEHYQKRLGELRASS